MGKLDVKMLRYLSKEDFRVLTAIEMGMKNHELVPDVLVAQIANLHHGGLHKILKELVKHRLIGYEQDKKYNGYRLTNTGYDYLALKTFTARNLIDRFGNQIGVGKESNIYVVSKNNEEHYVLKLHRLGRTCFRNVKNKRYYHQHRKHMSWLYMSRMSATKEFAFMRELERRGFPVPKPIDINRHCIIMELIDGVPLCNVHEIQNKERLYDDLMNIMCKLAHCGVIHGDFNEFNIMLTPDEKPIIIDFPQMIPTDHEEAEMYFDRDVQCIREFFRRRFDYESERYPVFKKVMKECKKEEISKVSFDDPVLSDDEDYQPIKGEEYYSNTEDEEDKADSDKEESVEELEQKVSKLNVEIKTDGSIKSNVQNYKEEVQSAVPELIPISLQDAQKKVSCSDKKNKDNDSDETDSYYAESTTDMMSTASTIIPDDLVKKRIKVEMMKREKKVQNRRNLKKASTCGKVRRDNRAIARDSVAVWDDM
ncbi:serine/threonine-protein kinase RIO2 [Phymastichus coffea]|uniref:serine/threonine-protein kinase RIO2 n=1 Tax=Phymastichus coffea TaxID=108790 RepID=UPI00273B765D|nr:serine/threonine-protein kinase RIO2 [Phymastichus coffea]